ncbi:hypothetical protein BASA81_003832 [Batrachochytrium salamandrivorans]|nr:hypothetical protein BASA81_003832 [Batrachochytrium salamandrivorans]
MWIALLAVVMGVALAMDKTYTAQCRVREFVQPKDHFGFHPVQETFKQRVLINTKHFRRGHPIFFYFGNEANVELYVEHSGLMWENAAKFGAALVFAEHRGYGKSQLCELDYFTTEQAMHDFASVITQLKQEWGAGAVIGFGGSYGGMLATAFRFHYPHLVDGVIAASAPVLSYLNMDPKYDSSGFAQIVTRDAGPKCAAMVRKELKYLYELPGPDMRRKAKQEFKLCDAHGLSNLEFVEWLQSAWDYMAMGNFPYSSSYVQPNGGMLPAHPIQAACERLSQGGGLKSVAELFYNATGDLDCFPLRQAELGLMGRTWRGGREEKGCLTGSWGYQYCTNHLMPFSSGTSKDMFYPPTGEFNERAASSECEKEFGVRPNAKWAVLSYGGLSGLQRGISNVVFSNGLLDPWSAGGVLSASGFASSSVKVVLIPSGAHHIDLMFSHPDDPEDVKQARAQELAEIAAWIQQANHHQPPVVAMRTMGDNLVQVN